jgi:hypothetical protein
MAIEAHLNRTPAITVAMTAIKSSTKKYSTRSSKKVVYLSGGNPGSGDRTAVSVGSYENGGFVSRSVGRE